MILTLAAAVGLAAMALCQKDWSTCIQEIPGGLGHMARRRESAWCHGQAAGLPLQACRLSMGACFTTLGRRVPVRHHYQTIREGY